MNFISFYAPRLLLVLVVLLSVSSCKKSSDNGPTVATDGTYATQDQAARPAINTVFVNTNFNTPAQKDQFNTTIPSAMAAAFTGSFTSTLNSFTGSTYTTNALGQNESTFIGLLVTDVLNVSTSGTTTFYDGHNVLTGRTLADDVIDTELLLIFGGPAGTSNPGLTTDHVNSNDKPFLTSFPYLAAPF